MKENKEIANSASYVSIDSILDLNSDNIWGLDESAIAYLWEKERKEEDFAHSEEKMLNVIRLAFDVNHFDQEDERESARFRGWTTFKCCDEKKGSIAIRRKTISRITDITYENVKHISASLLLELIDKNFGGGWDSLSLALRDIIESGFEISTTQLPASRIHMKGGTLEKKVAQGFEVLEVPKGTWVEAIFAKKKEWVSKVKVETEPNKFADSEEDEQEYDDDEEVKRDDLDVEDEEDNDNDNDDTFYSSFAPEAEAKPEDEEGFPLEEE